MGVISMKLAGEGTFDREDRRKAMRFAFRNYVGQASPRFVRERAAPLSASGRLVCLACSSVVAGETLKCLDQSDD